MDLNKTFKLNLLEKKKRNKAGYGHDANSLMKQKAPLG